jgi:hypothetical protein
VAEWLLLTGAGSYVRLVSICGVLTVSLFAGIFPVLLLVASRRKGDLVPTTVYPLLAHPLVVCGIYLAFLGIILVHGLVIWQEPVERALALALAALVVALTVHAVRRGAFAARAVVELRQELAGQETGTFSVTVVGNSRAASVRLDYPEGCRRQTAAQGQIPSFSRLRGVTLELPTEGAREIKVWAHRVTLERTSEPLPIRVDVVDGSDPRHIDLAACGGQVVLPLTGSLCRLELTPSASEA